MQSNHNTHFNGILNTIAQNYHKISKMQSNHNKLNRITGGWHAQNYHKISKMQSNHNPDLIQLSNLQRKITTKFQKCNQITTIDLKLTNHHGAKLPQNFKNAIKSQQKERKEYFCQCAKLPQNFKNAIKSQPYRTCLSNSLAQNYHKISKMQSNHNELSDQKQLLARKITTKFQKCNQITTSVPCRNKYTLRKITTKFQKCNQITTHSIIRYIPFSAKLPQNFKNAIKSQHGLDTTFILYAQNYHKISKMQSNHNRITAFIISILAQNYHKISKMQSNHNKKVASTLDTIAQNYHKISKMQSNHNKKSLVHSIL